MIDKPCGGLIVLRGLIGLIGLRGLRGLIYVRKIRVVLCQSSRSRKSGHRSSSNIPMININSF